MGTTAEDGPLITFGQAQTAPGNPPNASNPQIGPNAWYQGDMIIDPRFPYTYIPGERSDQPNYGWPTVGSIPIIDQVPSAASTTNIVDAATPTAGTPLTLVSSSGSGVTVGCQVINALTNQTVKSLLGLDVAAARTFTGTFTNGSAKITYSGTVNPFGAQVGDQATLTTSGTLPTPFALSTTYYICQITNGALTLAASPGGAPIAATSAGSGTQTVNLTAPNTFGNTLAVPFQPAVIFGLGGAGTGGNIRQWNPAWALSRTLIITTNGSDSGGFYTVAGYDIYGYPMTQKVTGVNNSTVSTTKAFKYITSITPSGTINSTAVSVGTNDNFGLPLRVDWPEYLTLYWNSAQIIAGTTGSSTFTAPDIQTASSTTADVRGLVYGGSASDGTKRMYAFWNPQANNLNSTVGYLGQQQA